MTASDGCLKRSDRRIRSAIARHSNSARTPAASTNAIDDRSIVIGKSGRLEAISTNRLTSSGPLLQSSSVAGHKTTCPRGKRARHGTVRAVRRDTHWRLRFSVVSSGAVAGPPRSAGTFVGGPCARITRLGVIAAGRVAAAASGQNPTKRSFAPTEAKVSAQCARAAAARRIRGDCNIQ